MEDCFALPSRGSRVSYTGESGSDQNDQFNYHQGGRSAPDWDPYGFHQQGKPGTGTDSVPRTMPKLDTVPLPKPGETAPTPNDTLPLPPLPDRQPPREVRLQDGAINKFDELGRVVFTGSADGRKTREVRYEDQNNAERVTQVIIDRNRVYTRNADGNSWSYQVNGRPSGTWYGDVHMNRQGEYSFEDATTGVQRKFAPNTQEITQPGPNNVPSDNVSYVRSTPCYPGQECYPQNQTGNRTYQPVQPQYYTEAVQQPQNYYRPGDPYIYHPGAPVIRQPAQPEIYQPGARYNYPTQNEWGRYYNPAHPEYSRVRYTRQCDSGYYEYDPRYDRGGRTAARFGLSLLAGMSGIGRYGGYYGGYNPYYGGYRGGNVGAMVCSIIGRAIGGRHCRW